MKKLIILVLALFPVLLSSQVTISTGNHRSIFPSGPPPTYATVNCTTSQAFASGTSNSITLPPCATAGDLEIIFISSQNTITTPTGWFLLTGNPSAAFITGIAIYKQLTSGDVSTGSVTLATSGSGAISTASVEFAGLPKGGTSSGDTSVYLSTATTSLTIAAPTSTGVLGGDTVFYFGSNNGTGPVTSSRGSSLQTTTGGLPSVLSSEQVASPSVGLTSTFTYTGYTSQGVFNAAVVVHGGTSYTPEAIPGLELWISADCITRSATVCSVPSNGSTINASGWVNRYGTANYNNSSITGTATFNTGVIGGLPAVTMATTAFSIGTTPTSATTPTAVTVGAAWKNSSSAAKAELLGSILGGPAYWTCGGSKQQGFDKQGAVQIASGTTACDTSWHYAVGAVTNGSFPSFTLDGSTDATINGGTATFSTSPQSIGRSELGGGSEYLDGQLGELVYYSGELTAAQIAILNTYLSRW